MLLPFKNPKSAQVTTTPISPFIQCLVFILAIAFVGRSIYHNGNLAQAITCVWQNEMNCSFLK